MPIRLLLTGSLCLLLAACGYRGDLYLPKQGDKARFGPLQTGLQTQPVQPQNQADHD